MKAQIANREIDTYFSLLTPEQKKSVVSLIKSFLKSDKRITKKQYNAEIEAAEKRIAKGEYLTHEQVKKNSEKW